MIENINIKVKNKNTQLLPSSREMHVKMNLSQNSKEYSDFTNTQQDLHLNNSKSAVHAQNAQVFDNDEQVMQEVKVPFDLGPKQQSFNSNNTNHNNIRSQLREEDQQCDIDDQLTYKDRMNRSNLNNYKSEFRTAGVGFNLAKDQRNIGLLNNESSNQHNHTGQPRAQTTDPMCRTSANQNYYMILRQQRQGTQHPNQKPDFTKVKLTQSQYRLKQNKLFSKLSDNVRPKSQNLLSKITKQRDEQYEKEQKKDYERALKAQHSQKTSQNLIQAIPLISQLQKQQHTEIVGSQVPHQSADNQLQKNNSLANPTSQLSSTARKYQSQNTADGMTRNKKGIFSRKNLRSSYARKNLDQLNMTFNHSSLNQDLTLMINVNGATNRPLNNNTTNVQDPYQGDLFSTGQALRSNRFSQQKLEATASDYSHESSRLRKSSPYMQQHVQSTYIQYSALKSQYYKPFTTNSNEKIQGGVGNIGTELNNSANNIQSNQDMVPSSNNNNLQNENLGDSSNNLKNGGSSQIRSNQRIRTQVLNSRNMSIEMKRRTQMKKDFNTQTGDTNRAGGQGNQSSFLKKNQTLSTCFFEPEIIPDFVQVKSELQRKRQSVKDSYYQTATTVTRAAPHYSNTTYTDASTLRQQPIFITSTRKGLGLQRECAKSHMINYKSSLGQKVLKVSIDDPMKVKHKLWVDQKQRFLKSINYNNLNLYPQTVQNHSLEDMMLMSKPTALGGQLLRSSQGSNLQQSLLNNSNPINLTNIMQGNISSGLVQGEKSHQWTPKSSIMIEFQEPYKQSGLNDSTNQNNYSHYDSHLSSGQQRSLSQLPQQHQHHHTHNSGNHQQNSCQNNPLGLQNRQKSNKIIYSFNKHCKSSGIRNSNQSQPQQMRAFGDTNQRNSRNNGMLGSNDSKSSSVMSRNSYSKVKSKESCYQVEEDAYFRHTLDCHNHTKNTAVGVQKLNVDSGQQSQRDAQRREEAEDTDAVEEIGKQTLEDEIEVQDDQYPSPRVHQKKMLKKISSKNEIVQTTSNIVIISNSQSPQKQPIQLKKQQTDQQTQLLEGSKDLDSSQMHSLENEQLHMSKQIYPAGRLSMEHSKGGSLENTIINHSLNCSRDNIEEAQDINVTSISIKVDQKKMTIDKNNHINNHNQVQVHKSQFRTLDKNHSSTSANINNNSNTYLIEGKSLDLVNSSNDTTNRASGQQQKFQQLKKVSRGHINEQNKSNSVTGRRAGQYSEHNSGDTNAQKTSQKGRPLTTEPKIINGVKYYSRNLTVQNHKDQQYSITQQCLPNLTNIRRQIEMNENKDRFINRAKSAQSKTRPLQRTINQAGSSGEDIQNDNYRLYSNVIHNNQTRFYNYQDQMIYKGGGFRAGSLSPVIGGAREISNHSNEATRKGFHSPIPMTQNSQTRNSSKHIINVHKVSTIIDQRDVSPSTHFHKTNSANLNSQTYQNVLYQQENKIAPQHSSSASLINQQRQLQRGSKMMMTMKQPQNFMSKVQGRSDNQSRGGDSNLDGNQVSHYVTRRGHSTRPQIKKDQNEKSVQDILLERVSTLSIDPPPERQMIMIHDHDSNHTVQMSNDEVVKKSIITINDEGESTLLKKSQNLDEEQQIIAFLGTSLGQENVQEIQLIKPIQHQIRVKSSKDSKTSTSQHHSRAILRTNYETFNMVGTRSVLNNNGNLDYDKANIQQKAGDQSHSLPNSQQQQRLHSQQSMNNNPMIPAQMLSQLQQALMHSGINRNNNGLYLQQQQSNQEFSTKRTVLMKHKQQKDLNSHNVQTGSETGQSFYKIGHGLNGDFNNSKSIVALQFLVKEDLQNRDLDLQDMLDTSQIVKQRKRTDLPRHSLAAPNILKQNYELVQGMRNTENLFFGTSSQKNQNVEMLMTFSESTKKVDQMINGKPSVTNTQQNATRNMNQINYFTQNQQRSIQQDQCDLIIDPNVLRLQNQVHLQNQSSLSQDMIENSFNNEQEEHANSKSQLQNVQIPMPKYVQAHTANQSQFSSIKNQSRQQHNQSQIHQQGPQPFGLDQSNAHHSNSRGNSLPISVRPGSREGRHSNSTTKNDEIHLSILSIQQHLASKPQQQLKPNNDEESFVNHDRKKAHDEGGIECSQQQIEVIQDLEITGTNQIINEVAQKRAGNEDSTYINEDPMKKSAVSQRLKQQISTNKGQNKRLTMGQRLAKTKNSRNIAASNKPGQETELNPSLASQNINPNAFASSNIEGVNMTSQGFQNEAQRQLSIVGTHMTNRNLIPKQNQAIQL